MKHDDDKPKKGAATDPKATPGPGGRATPAPARVGAPTVEASGATINGAPAKAAKADDSGGVAGGLDRAIAEGNVEIIQDKLSDDGTISHNVGHGKRATYESSTGDITLYGKPDVQQGINSCVALDEGTIIILNRNGQMRTIGRTTNYIREASSATPSPRNKPAASNTDGR